MSFGLAPSWLGRCEASSGLDVVRPSAFLAQQVRSLERLGCRSALHPLVSVEGEGLVSGSLWFAGVFWGLAGDLLGICWGFLGSFLGFFLGFSGVSKKLKLDFGRNFAICKHEICRTQV